MFRTEPSLPEDEWQVRLDLADVADSGVAVLVLDRPERLNAWSWEASRQLGVLTARIRFDERVRALVVRGEGRAFCAGVDLGMPEDRITGRSAAERARNFAEGLRWVHDEEMREDLKALRHDPAEDARRQLGLRTGRRHEIGWAATYLCSPFASFVTGHTLVVDGGNWLRRDFVMPPVTPIAEQLAPPRAE